MNPLLLRYLTEMQNKGCLKFYKDRSLSLVSTFGIGGKASVFVLPETEEALIDTVCMASALGRYKVIGNASNLLFDDRGFSGAVISTVRLRSLALSDAPTDPHGRRLIEKCGGRFIRCGCGVMLPSLSAFAARSAVTGFEGLCSIPATVGGAIRQNAGAYGSEISDTLVACEVFYPDTHEKRLIYSEECGFSYRHSLIGRKGETVLSAYFKAEPGEEREINERIARNKAYRLASQPTGVRSAGSYFCRPSNETSAGELIDRCGLKGMRVGGAEVSTVHANFIVNKTGIASADDVLRLASAVKRNVKKRFGVELTEEVEFVPRRSGNR